MSYDGFYNFDVERLRKQFIAWEAYLPPTSPFSPQEVTKPGGIIHNNKRRENTSMFW